MVVAQKKSLEIETQETRNNTNLTNPISNHSKSHLWREGDRAFVSINGAEKLVEIVTKKRNYAIVVVDEIQMFINYDHLKKHSIYFRSWLMDKVEPFFPLPPLIPTELEEWEADYLIIEPPLNKIKPWLTQFELSFHKGGIAILPVQTEADWWGQIRGDICFVRLLQSDRPYCIVHIGEESDRFCSTFSSLGAVWQGVC